jgi:hypothetical protein
VRCDPRPTMPVVHGTGMWECVDFYPIVVALAADENGLETSAAPGLGVKHVVKASFDDDDKHGYYAMGTYDAVTDTWTPDDAENGVGVRLRYDYASTTRPGRSTTRSAGSVCCGGGSARPTTKAQTSSRAGPRCR